MPLALCAIVVIGLSLVLISIAIAAFTVTWDPCSVLGGVILLPLPTVLAVQQYRGAFRANASAAFTSAVLLFVVAGIGLFGFVTTFGELVLEGMGLPWWDLLVPMLMIGIAAGLAGWLNLRWSRRIRRIAVTFSDTIGSPQFSLRELLGAFAAIQGVIALATYIVYSTPPQYAENVSRDAAPFGLPPRASDVSYCRGSRGTIAYEFSIDEGGFIEWVRSGIGSLECQSAGVELKPIVTPYRIRRYYAISLDLQGPDEIVIADGLYYAWYKEDRGVYAAFDRKTGRAYYFAHSY
jgi:hypothetical protein